jgi:hypothetical protein
MFFSVAEFGDFDEAEQEPLAAIEQSERTG